LYKKRLVLRRILNEKKMKKIIYLTLLGTAFLSCSKDSNKNSSPEGTWKLKTLTTAIPIDFNNDCNATTDLKTETGCYNNTSIIFNSNGKGIGNLESVDTFLALIDPSNPQLYYGVNCETSTPKSFTWSQKGNEITIEGDQIKSTISESTLITVLPEFEFKDLQNGQVIRKTTKLTYVFTRQ
jgi:hypothetical protein